MNWKCRYRVKFNINKTACTMWGEYCPSLDFVLSIYRWSLLFWSYRISVGIGKYKYTSRYHTSGGK
jgi:hypothetical protein